MAWCDHMWWLLHLNHLLATGTPGREKDLPAALSEATTTTTAGNTIICWQQALIPSLACPWLLSITGLFLHNKAKNPLYKMDRVHVTSMYVKTRHVGGNDRTKTLSEEEEEYYNMNL